MAAAFYLIGVPFMGKSPTFSYYKDNNVLIFGELSSAGVFRYLFRIVFNDDTKKGTWLCYINYEMV